MQKAFVKVSAKYQVLIPKAVREELMIRPGQELFMYTYESSIRVSLQRPILELRGLVKGMKWRGEDRDRKDRF
jgi:AbrB family looped-hinge helix DNA binding protein